ncbi:MAG: endolytic transglycosylase MltG [Elainellaceae cyanobacterium]
MLKWLFYLLIFPATLGVAGWQGWAWWSWASAPVQTVATPTDEEVAESLVQYDISQGTSARQIGRDLAAAGLIQSEMAWNLWTRWQTVTNRPGGFLAGTYVVSPLEPMGAIANRIWTGDVVELSVTIPEGWTLEDIASAFAAQGDFTAEDFIAASRQVSQADYPWLPAGVFAADGANLEGFLYPDTYRLANDATPARLVRQMLNRFEQVALPVYERQSSPYSLLEWVTLSSIVEREAVIASERPLIAAVFAKRLRENIPLGADPTVEYALGIRQTPENPLTFSDIRTPSPYNTYRNPGLPPGPIANPGVASLEASLNPPDTEFLYFVARYDGTHVFSRTLQEHEAAQAQIRDRIDSQ